MRPFESLPVGKQIAEKVQIPSSENYYYKNRPDNTGQKTCGLFFEGQLVQAKIVAVGPGWVPQNLLWETFTNNVEAYASLRDQGISPAGDFIVFQIPDGARKAACVQSGGEIPLNLGSRFSQSSSVWP